MPSKLGQAVREVFQHSASAKLNALGHARKGRRKSSLVLRPESGTPIQITVPALARIGATTAAAGASKRANEIDAAFDFLNRRARQLGLDDPSRELRIDERFTDSLGRSHIRFEQVYNNLRVWPGAALLHFDPSGQPDLFSGAYVKTPRGIAISPRLSATEALHGAEVHIGRALLSLTDVGSELIIYAPLNKAPRLAWKLDIAESLLQRWCTVVDAQSGEILLHYNDVKDANVGGSGIGVFNERLDLNVWREGGEFFLVDTSKPMYDPRSNPPEPDSVGGGIIILDARNQPPTSNPQSLPRLSLITSGNANSGWLPDGVSAAFGLSQTYDYFLERHQRNSIDGRGGTMIGIVRFGRNLFNAFWSNGLMLFGDAVPFSGGIDVAAHEMMHGVTESSANLVYQGQPGALNEAFSDIFGENVESFTYGEPDWRKGADLGDPIQNYERCAAVQYMRGVPYPTTFDDFVRTTEDNGGVHGNSCIINHAYYQLAQGLNGAIGIASAERIFYRALTVHLVRNSQFVDARFACIRSAEELFGNGSNEAQRTAEAFDAVRIFGGDATPEPPTFPGVQGPDSTIFIAAHPSSAEDLVLLRREQALGDSALGTVLSCNSVAASRPSVSGDGEVVVFVTSDNNFCVIDSNAGLDLCEECADFAGQVHSLALAPDRSQIAFVLLDDSGMPENNIVIVDTESGGERSFPLRAPLVDGQAIGTVRFAEIMDFTADGHFLVYDAFNEIPIGSGEDLGLWSIYALDLQNNQTLTLVEPQEGLAIGNPSISQTSDNFLAFDVTDGTNTSVVAMNVNSSEVSEVAPVNGGLGLGFPSYSGDDSGIAFTQGDDVPLGTSIHFQSVNDDRINPSGRASVFLEDAMMGVIYRRGEFNGPPTPTATNQPTPTRTPAGPVEGCPGDCNLDGRVAIGELIIGVRIALGSSEVSACDEMDDNGDGMVRIGELIRAVAAALRGCTPEPR